MNSYFSCSKLSNLHLSNVSVCKTIIFLPHNHHLTFCCLVQKGGPRPPTAKPKDPSELNIEDEELAKDYRKMYERFTEMEAKMASLLPNERLKQNDIPDAVTG